MEYAQPIARALGWRVTVRGRISDMIDITRRLSASIEAR